MILSIPISFILLCLSLIILLIYVILYWRSYVYIPAQSDEAPQPVDKANAPSISVVIITHDSDDMLERVIDNIAGQNYPNFEIVVVNNASTDNTNDVIKRATAKYPNVIRHTYLPQNKNGILHMSIATTLGVRASRKEWIVLMRPNSTPKTNMWLNSIATAILQGYSLCLGYNDYYGYDDSAWVKSAIRWRKKHQILNFRAINRGKRKAIEAENTNIAFRKEDFLKFGGYGRWLDVKNYHENLYATTFYNSGEVAMLTEKDAQVEKLLPPIVDLWNTDKFLLKRAYKKFSRSTKLRRNYYSILTWLYIISVIVLGVGSYLAYCPLPMDTTSLVFDYNIYIGIDMPVVIAAAVLLFFIISLTHLIFKAYRNNSDYSAISVPLVSDPYADLNED